MWWNLIALALATPPQLDLAAVAARARAVSHASERAAAAIDLARTDRTRALQRLNPNIGLSARYTRISEEDPIVIDPGIPGFTVTIPGAKPDQWAFGVSITFPLSDWLVRRSAIDDTTRASIAAQEALKTMAERRASLEAMLSHLSLIRVVRAEAVARQTLADAERRALEVKRRLEARLVSEADLRLAEVDIATRKQALQALNHARRLVLTQLSTLLDLELDPLADSALSLDLPPFESFSPQPELELLLAEAWGSRPEPRALGQQDRALAGRSKLARAQRLPRLDLAAQGQLVDPNQRTIVQEDGLVGIWDVSAVVSWPLEGLWQADTEERGLAAERAALAADRRALEDGLRLEIASALSSLSDAESQHAAAKVMIEAASEGYRVRLALFQASAATAIEVTEAETQLSRARLALVDAELGLWVGKVRLDHALGRPL